MCPNQCLNQFYHIFLCKHYHRKIKKQNIFHYHLFTLCSTKYYLQNSMDIRHICQLKTLFLSLLLKKPDNQDTSQKTLLKFSIVFPLQLLLLDQLWLKYSFLLRSILFKYYYFYYYQYLNYYQYYYLHNYLAYFFHLNRNYPIQVSSNFDQNIKRRNLDLYLIFNVKFSLLYHYY